MKNGFTLPELLATIAIIGILSSLALPLFSEHITKAQVLEGIHLATQAKLRVTDYAHSHALSSIRNNESLGLPKPTDYAGKYVSKITVQSGGKIQVSFKDPVGSFTFIPLIKYGFIKWTCASNSAELNAFLPASCSRFNVKEEKPNGK